MESKGNPYRIYSAFRPLYSPEELENRNDFKNADPKAEAKSSPQSISGDENEQPPLINTKALSKYAKTYELEKFEKNVLIIFNQKKFDGHPKKTRFGTEKDVKALTRTFSKFGFEVVEHSDFTIKQIRAELGTFSRRNFTDYGCVAVAVLTHGKDNGTKIKAGSEEFLKAKDDNYNKDEITEAFKNNPTLVTKPKIFIIQACRGEMTVPGVPVFQKRMVTRDCDVPSYSLPRESDILIVNGCYKGTPSYRNILLGSWFIQELCKKIESRAATEDLESILTEVQREVAIYQQYDKFKQMITYESTLIRKLYLRKFGEQPMQLPTSKDYFDNCISKTPLSVQQGPCSSFLFYFKYLWHVCLGNSHNNAAQYSCLSQEAYASEEGDQYIYK